MSNCMDLLAIATTAIRDQYMGFPDDEIVANSGKGMKTLLRDLVAYLRENGVDDEGGWDCDATRDIEVEQVPDFEPFKLVVEAYARNQFGESPDWAEITITPSFLAQLKRLQRLCDEEGLDSVTVLDAPDAWDQEEDLIIVGDRLRVMKGIFWYEAYPKYADHDIETRSLAIDRLVVIAEIHGGKAPEANLPKGFYVRNGVYFYDATYAENLAYMYFDLEALAEAHTCE